MRFLLVLPKPGFFPGAILFLPYWLRPFTEQLHCRVRDINPVASFLGSAGFGLAAGT